MGLGFALHRHPPPSPSLTIIAALGLGFALHRHSPLLSSLTISLGNICVATGEVIAAMTTTNADLDPR